MHNTEPKSPTAAESAESNPEGIRRILVGDDDPATAILEKEHYGVAPARDGRAAYKSLQSDQNFTAPIFDGVMATRYHVQMLIGKTNS